MTRPSCLAAALGCLACMAAAWAAEPPRFHTRTEIVPVYATVTDAENRLIPDLEPHDFEILDDGDPQPIVLFKTGTEPVTAVIMLDTSSSMTGRLELVREAAEQFIRRLMPGDKALVGAFSGRIEFGPRFTSDRESLVASLWSLRQGNPTRLYDGVAAALDKLAGLDGRRVTVVFSDGDDTASDQDLEVVLDRAVTDDVMIYGIGLRAKRLKTGRQTRPRPATGLKQLARLTGGRYFELNETDALARTFAQVAKELHSQYLLGFVPAVPDGRVHQVQVRVSRPGLVARTRTSYLATSPPAATR